MRKILSICVFAAAMPFASSHASPAPSQPARLGLCAACHGEDGQARIPGAPNLAGQRYEYLLHALHEYRSGQRNVPVMRAATGPLSGREMEELAHWYSQQSPCKAPQAGDR